MMDTKKTKGQEVAADISALLRARNPLLWVVTREEARVELYLMEAAKAAGYMARTWDVAQGAANIGDKTVKIGGTDPGEMLAAIRERAEEGGAEGPERCVWIMRDLPGWLSGLTGLATLRQLRNVARFLPGVDREKAQAIVVLTPSADIPPE